MVRKYNITEENEECFQNFGWKPHKNKLFGEPWHRDNSINVVHDWRYWQTFLMKAMTSVPLEEISRLAV
jgi:hypothetical protein